MILQNIITTHPVTVSYPRISKPSILSKFVGWRQNHGQCSRTGRLNPNSWRREKPQPTFNLSNKIWGQLSVLFNNGVNCYNYTVTVTWVTGHTTLVVWYWQEKNQWICPPPLSPSLKNCLSATLPQISCGLAWDGTRACIMTSEQLTTWPLAQAKHGTESLM
jgi:hypothetical protein